MNRRTILTASRRTTLVGPLSRLVCMRGFSLVEVMIATLILVVVSAGLVSGMTASTMMTRNNTYAVMAKNISQSYFEQMAEDAFADVGPVNYPDIAINAPDPVILDTAHGIACAVDIEFKGFGLASSGSGSQLTDTQADWDSNEWAGSRLYLVSGPGVGQYRTIASNDATTLNLEGSSFTPPPTAGTGYMINNGKTVGITTTWIYRNKVYSQTIVSLIVNRDNETNLGL